MRVVLRLRYHSTESDQISWFANCMPLSLLCRMTIMWTWHIFKRLFIARSFVGLAGNVLRFDLQLLFCSEENLRTTYDTSGMCYTIDSSLNLRNNAENWSKKKFTRWTNSIKIYVFFYLYLSRDVIFLLTLVSLYYTNKNNTPET